VKKRIKRGYRISKYVLYKETLIDYREFFWTFCGAFFGIGIIAFLQSFSISKMENVFLLGSFGASSVLIYGAIQSPLAQPRNLIGGHVVSSIIGVTVYKIFPDLIWVSAPMAVALSIVAMQITKTLHPPGGATALIAVIGTPKIKELGYLYVLSPVLAGTLILFATALIFNNMTTSREYPTNSRLTKYFTLKSIRSVVQKMKRQKVRDY